MAEHRSPAWRELLQDALSQLNTEKLPEKICPRRSGHMPKN